MTHPFRELVGRLRRETGRSHVHASLANQAMSEAATAIESLLDEVDEQAERLKAMYGLPAELAEMKARVAAAEAEVERVTRERDAYRDALDPNETKAAYIGEVKFTTVDLDEFGDERTVHCTLEWTTTKDVMAMIKDRARRALSSDAGER